MLASYRTRTMTSSNNNPQRGPMPMTHYQQGDAKEAILARYRKMKLAATSHDENQQRAMRKSPTPSTPLQGKHTKQQEDTTPTPPRKTTTNPTKSKAGEEENKARPPRQDRKTTASPSQLRKSTKNTLVNERRQDSRAHAGADVVQKRTLGLGHDQRELEWSKHMKEVEHSGQRLTRLIIKIRKRSSVWRSSHYTFRTHGLRGRARTTVCARASTTQRPMQKRQAQI